jgi:hypothetical protein
MVLYQHTCDEILNKVKVPYQLLVHSVQDLITLNIYCAEICHAIKTAEKLAVPCRKDRFGSQKPGWDKCPLVKQAKKRAKL